LNGDRSIHSFGITDLGGGYLWCGTGSPANGSTIFRTQDGVTWTEITLRGFGNPLLTGAAPHMVVFQGPADAEPYLYAGMGSHGGGTPGQVWRTPYTNTDPNNWVRLVDCDTIDASMQTITYFYAWNNKIYFGTDGTGQLWESTDGTNFTQNTGVGNGFSVPTNKVLSSFEEFNGQLYATTNNQILGGQIWRTADGASWSLVTNNAFSKADSVTEMRSLRASFGKLWVTGYTDTSKCMGTPIWQSDDGTTWVQSNVDGFGDINNNGQNAITIGFGDYQYFGGPNYIDGGQVWRANMATTSINQNGIDCNPVLAPNPFNDHSVLYLKNGCSQPKQIEIYDVLGKRIRIINSEHNLALTIKRRGLKAGIYFFKLQFVYGSGSSGKFVVR